MKITDLKTLFEEKANEKRKELDKKGDTKEVTIKGSYTIRYGYTEIIAKKFSEYEPSRFKQLIIAIKGGGHFAYDWQTIDKDEIEYYQKQLLIMVDYWKEYAKLTKAKDILFITQSGQLDNRMIEAFKPILSKDMNPKYVELQTYFFAKNNEKFLGGIIFEEYANYIDRFLEAKETFEHIQTQYPLITINKNDGGTWEIYSRLYFEYCGEKLVLTPFSDFEKCTIIFSNSKQFKDTLFELEFNEESLHQFFADVKEKMIFPNLMKPPMVNFTELIRLSFQTLKETIIESLFNELVDKLDSWEEVELEAKEILDNYPEVYDALILDIKGTNHNVEFETLLDTTDEKQDVELKIYKFKTKKYCYHFISKRNDAVRGKEFEIIQSSEECPNKVKELLVTYLLPQFK
ncbi:MULTISPECIES: hypothetical protein [Bacillus cereus group]|uniref:Uncharacterized protein n=1 Tax=Bacillus thuringiensis TaxID=1428 RepID=A0A9X6ZQ59_BACTU|nr:MULTISPECIES: hypothetical protein [Bacillus cereus group]PFJ29068.1 hypothetical protein COJ15_32915 [Bacillus thuringiensis]PGP14675.1 hypothetical protein COA01_30445 [Bacillus cereus]